MTQASTASPSRLDRLPAVRAGLAGRHAELDDLLGREEGKRRGAHREPRPVVPAFGRVHLAFGVTGGARGSPDRVGCFQREERLVPVDHIDGRERPREVGLELAGAELEPHATRRPGPASPRRADA